MIHRLASGAVVRVYRERGQWWWCADEGDEACFGFSRGPFESKAAACDDVKRNPPPPVPRDAVDD